jgi:hypothetical protein
MQMMEALIQANKQFDFTDLSRDKIMVFTGMTRIQLHKMTNFIKDNL